MTVREKSFAAVRKRLEAERADLQAQMDALSIENENQDNDYGVGNHLADDASELFIRERNIALRNNAQDLMMQIDAALQHLDEGTYGICARCGQPIAEERLEALPYATMCVSCQAEVERAAM